MIEHLGAISTLTWQPYEFSLGGELTRELTLWRVSVDGKLFASTMQPFSASDEEIEGFACLTCGYPGCGGGWIAVRQFGPYVVWFRPFIQLDDLHGASPGMEAGAVLVFDAEHYAERLGNFDPQALPSLSPDELKLLIFAELPEPELALYCLPELASDPRGRKLLQRAQKILWDQVETIAVASEPEAWVELHLGLDELGVPECIWRVGKIESRWAVMFLNRPYLPVWLEGEAIAAIFASVVLADT